MDASGVLGGMTSRLAHMYNSSFFHILPRAQPEEWCAQQIGLVSRSKSALHKLA